MGRGGSLLGQLVILVPSPLQKGCGAFALWSGWSLLAGPCKLQVDPQGHENLERWTSGVPGLPPALDTSILFTYGLLQNVLKCKKQNIWEFKER